MNNQVTKKYIEIDTKKYRIAGKYTILGTMLTIMLTTGLVIYIYNLL